MAKSQAAKTKKAAPAVKKTSNIKKNLSPKTFVESHWTVFAIQGLIAMGFGVFALFTGITDVAKLMTITAAVLGVMGIIELCSALYKRQHSQVWVATAFIALIQIAVAIALVCTRDALYVTNIAIIAGYALVRGAFEVYLGMTALKDKVDKTIWTISGVFGVILGFVILADPGRSQTTFVKMFGIYLAILGLTNLTFAIHQKNTKK